MSLNDYARLSNNDLELYKQLSDSSYRSINGKRQNSSCRIAISDDVFQPDISTFLHGLLACRTTGRMAAHEFIQSDFL